MSSEHVDEALVRRLIEARTTRVGIPSPELSGEQWTPARAYGLQAHHENALLEMLGGQTIGIKLAGGDMKMMSGLGQTGPFRGPIFSALTYDSPASLNRSDFFGLCMVEAEIAVLLARDVSFEGDGLPGRATIAEAIGALVPSMEIADSRYSDFPKAHPSSIIADLAYAGAWVRGRPVENWRSIDLSKLTVRMFCAGKEIRSGTGAVAMGDPLEPLRYAVADLVKTGACLKAGQVVSTGTYTQGYLAKVGDLLIADFGALGTVTASFA